MKNEAILGWFYCWETNWIEIGNPTDFCNWETIESLIGQGIWWILSKRKGTGSYWIQPRISIDFLLNKPIEYIFVCPLLFPLPLPFGYLLFSSRYRLFSMGKKKVAVEYRFIKWGKQQNRIYSSWRGFIGLSVEHWKRLDLFWPSLNIFLFN